MEPRSYRQDFPARVSHVAQVLTASEIAEVVGTTASIVGRWRTGAVTPTGPEASLLLDLDYIVACYARHWPAHTFGGWLVAANSFLNGARPRDVLVAEGPTPVLRAMTAEGAGSVS